MLVFIHYLHEEVTMPRFIAIIICLTALIATVAHAQAPPAGSGPYPAVIEGDPGLSGYTIYRPEDLSPFNKKNPLPIFAWGNGGCANSNVFYTPFLAEIASQGFLVVAIGPYDPSQSRSMGGGMGSMGGGTKSAQLLEALDWATAENGSKNSKYYGKLDPSEFAVAGHSCGGLQALEVSKDPRIATTLVMDSGIFVGGPPKMPPPGPGSPNAGAPRAGGPNAGGPAPDAAMMKMILPDIKKDDLKKLHAPVIYINGGEKDMAYPNGVDDFAKIDTVPVAMANIDVGHGGTYAQPNGGEFGKVAVAWLKWQLKGDKTAEKMFAGPECGLCTDTEWKFEKKRIP
jgi:hypothetical protein